MNTAAPEDIFQALSSGRPVRDHGPYLIQIGDDALNFQTFTLQDPVPTGRQVIELTGHHPVIEHIAFQILQGGQLEELRLDETTDLRAGGVERFLVFRSDRTFRLEIDGEVFDWGTTRISGRVLKWLAKVDSATYGVWQEVRGQEDRAIGDDEFADLSTAGVERFFTGIVKTTEG